MGSVHRDPDNRQVYVVTKVCNDDQNVQHCERISIEDIEDPIISMWAAERGSNKHDPSIEIYKVRTLMRCQDAMYDYIRGVINEARKEDNRSSRATRALRFGGRSNQVIVFGG